MLVNIKCTCNNVCMTEKAKPRGAPKKPLDQKRIERLGVVQLTQKQLADYLAAAELEGKTKSDWVRDVLDAQAALTLSKKAAES